MAIQCVCLLKLSTFQNTKRTKKKANTTVSKRIEPRTKSTQHTSLHRQKKPPNAIHLTDPPNCHPYCMQPTTPSSTSFPAISKTRIKKQKERKNKKKQKLKNNIQTGNIFIKQFLSICVQYSYTIRLVCTRSYSSSLSLFTLLLPSPSSVCKLIASESSSYPLVPFVLPEYAAGAGPPWTWRKSRSRSYYTTVQLASSSTF